MARATAASEIWNGHIPKNPSPTTPKQTLRRQGKGFRWGGGGQQTWLPAVLAGQFLLGADRQTRHRTWKPLLPCRGTGPETWRVWLCSKCHSNQFQGSGHFSGGAEITKSALQLIFYNMFPIQADITVYISSGMFIHQWLKMSRFTANTTINKLF